MPSPLKHVYCFHYQIGSDNYYKVGLTKNPPAMRISELATGSPVKPTICRDVETEDASRLEKYIHQLLDPKRAANGEFFHVSWEELNHAVDKAVAFINRCQPVLREANKLRRKKPNDTVLEPTVSMLRIYRQLRDLSRKQFLMERRIEYLMGKVQVAIGENHGIKGIASWKWEDRWTMDVKRFQKEHETLYEQYKRDSGSRKFRLDRIDLTNI
jgi:hypothetical protein